MPMENAHDPRTALVRTKYFSLRPKPLEHWLWQQGLPQAAERVFWLHWEEGMRSGDWCSAIPIRQVARACCVDPSTVTRAYQVLKGRGLLRREDPGRDPTNPFQQATAITEVRLPRELVTELSRSPNRPAIASRKPEAGHMSASPEPIKSAALPPATPPQNGPGTSERAPVSATPTRAPDAAAIPRRPTRAESQAMWARASDGERTRYFAATRDRATTLEFDPASRLTPADRQEILSQLTQQAAAAPHAGGTQASPPKPESTGPRRLSVLDLARARRSITGLVPAASAAELFRQVIWAVEEGALRRFPLPLALNIAFKKIREGAWSRPHRLPPNWLPRSTLANRAAPEQCSAA